MKSSLFIESIFGKTTGVRSLERHIEGMRQENPSLFCFASLLCIFILNKLFNNFLKKPRIYNKWLSKDSVRKTLSYKKHAMNLNLRSLCS